MNRLVLGIAVLALAAASSLFAQPLTITSPLSLQRGVEAIAYNTLLTASGGIAPYTWTLTNRGTLPAAINLAANGTLSGTPPAAGSFFFRATIADSGSQSQSGDFTLIINPTLVINAQSLPDGRRGTPYTSGVTLSSTGGQTPVTWSVASGSFPPGMTLSSAGTLGGTPTSSGTFNFVAQAMDSGSGPANQVKTQSFSITIIEPLTITTNSPLTSAILNTPYSQQLVSAGGTPPYFTWSLTSGALPNGLTLDSFTGVISGTPTVTGTFNFTATVQDSAGPPQTASKPFVLIVTAAFNIITASPLPNGTVASSYSQTLSATGGTPPYSNWQVIAGALPGGLTLNASSGAIGGTPTAAGMFNFTVEVRDNTASTAQTATKAFSLTINAVPLTITTNSPLPNGTGGASYSQTFAASGGTSPYLNWIVISGALPAGLTLNPSNGVLSGTATQTGPFAFTVQVQDSASSPQTASKAFALTIDAVPFTITTPSPLPSGIEGSAYSQPFSAAGGIPQYRNWAVVAGALPSGLTLNPLTGVLSGTAGENGSFTFTVQVQDSTSTPQITSKPFTLTVAAQPTTITILTPLPSGTVNVSYSETLAAVGGTPPYTWSIVTGSLPPGLGLTSQGVLSGTPSQTGTFPFTIRVDDSVMGFDQKPYSIRINPTPLTITTASPLPDGVINTSYSQSFAVTGGVAPYTWSLVSGVLPTGLSVSSSGLLSGTPTQSGRFAINISVADNSGLVAFKPFDLTIDPGNPTITTTSPLPTAFAGVPYLLGLTGMGGTQPFEWTIISGSLPTGLTLATTGVISGTTSAVGSYSFTVQLFDARERIATRVFSLFVDSAPPTITTTSPLPNGIPGTTYSQTFAVSGGFAPYTWSLLSGSQAPPGLSLASNGILTGTPAQPGTFNFTVVVTDGHGSVGTKLFAVTFGTPTAPTITTLSLASGVINVFYSQSLTASGGVPPFVWSLSTGVLPPGLTITPTGIIQGTPSTTGTFNFIVRVTDGNSLTDTRPLSITIANQAPGFAITTPDPLPQATINVAYSQQFAAIGGFPPITWQIVGGALPTGLTLSSTGLLSGVPTQPGTFLFVVRARDTDFTAIPSASELFSSAISNAGPAAAQSTDRTFTLVVDAGLVVTTTFLPNGLTLQNYSTTLTAAGGVPPYTWSLAGGTLPPGFTLTTDGQLIGTASRPEVSSFTAQVTDRVRAVATRNLLLIISVPGQVGSSPVEISTLSLPDATAGKLYAMVLAARNGSPPYTWSFSGLPPGLQGNSDGEITGTAQSPSTATVRVTVTDSNRGQANAVFSLVVQPGQISITPSRLPDGRVEEGYSAGFGATGGLPPYAFAVIGGALPPGVTLAASGALSGIPGQPGTFEFTIQATDAAAQKGTKGYSILIRPGVLRITTASLGNGVVGVPYSAGVGVTGGTPAYRFSATGLPDGLSIDSITGVIAGTPTRNGAFSVTVGVSDQEGQTTSRSYSVEVAAQVVITTLSIGNMVVGTPVSVTLAASGGLPPYTWSITGGALPSGISLSTEGVISGTPNQMGLANFTVQARDANGVPGSRPYTVRVVDPLVITTQSLPAAPFAVAYSATLAVTGGTAPYSWSLASGSLPTGLSLSATGAISGTASQGGVYNFTARVTDTGTPQLTADRPLSIVVSLPDVSGLTIAVPQNPQPAQQIVIGVSIGSVYPLEITGTLNLTFAPNATNNADDPAIQFSTGGRSAPFRIPAGQTQAVFSVTSLGLQTGTTAGTITLSTTLTGGGSSIGCNCPLNQTIVIPRTAPVITTLRVQRTATGFSVMITGFSTTREVNQGTFRFAGTSNLQTTDLTVQLAATFNPYFQGQASSTFGGQFSLTIPFTIQGDTTNVNSVTATLTNSVGTSQASTASF